MTPITRLAPVGSRRLRVRPNGPRRRPGSAPSPTQPAQEPEGNSRTEPAARPLYWDAVLDRHSIPETIYAIAVLMEGDTEVRVRATRIRRLLLERHLDQRPRADQPQKLHADLG